jgi:hypothetical protein
VAEEFQYPTFDEARAVAERIEIQAAQNHLEHPESETLVPRAEFVRLPQWERSSVCLPWCY